MISDGIFVCVGGRQSGKTTELIKEVHKNAGTIVTINKRSKKNILDKAEELNLKIKDPITYDDFINQDLKFKICRFYIDDIDIFLKKLFPLLTIEGITITKK